MLTVSHVRGNSESTLLALAHTNETLIPPTDNLANTNYGTMSVTATYNLCSTYGSKAGVDHGHNYVQGKQAFNCKRVVNAALPGIKLLSIGEQGTTLLYIVVQFQGIRNFIHIVVNARSGL